jgi:nucleoside-diphosphate-sugar epimerase
MSDTSDRWTGSRVLVTGACGFIGSHLVAALVRQGAIVHGVIRASSDTYRLDSLRSEIELHRADLLDTGAIARAVVEARPEVVFHLAATGGHPTTPTDRRRHLETAVIGTANLIESVTDLGLVRFVHFGSSLEYQPAHRPLREDDPVLPQTFRGAAKAAATLIVRQAGEALGTPVTIVRPFHVYGPNEQPDRLVPTLMRGLVHGLPIELSDVSRRDLVHVDDVVDASLHVARSSEAVGRSFNIGSGQQTSPREVLATLVNVTGLEPAASPQRYSPRPWDPGVWAADINAVQLLGWRPRFDLETGLTETWDWYVREHGINVAVRT